MCFGDPSADSDHRGIWSCCDVQCGAASKIEDAVDEMLSELDYFFEEEVKDV